MGLVTAGSIKAVRIAQPHLLKPSNCLRCPSEMGHPDSVPSSHTGPQSMPSSAESRAGQAPWEEPTERMT